jgi:hypothetical protein
MFHDVGPMAGCYRAPMSRRGLFSAVPALVRPIGTVGIAMLGVLAAVGCQPASNGGQPLLTDPAEVVMAGVRSTAALHAVHARFDISAQMAGGQQLGGPQQQFSSRAAIDLDIDLDTRSLAGRSVTAGMGGPDQTSDVILVGGQQFSRNAPDTRWTQFPQFGPAMPFPTNDQLVESISAVIENGGAQLSLTEPEACGEATCYHAVADLDPTATWQLMAPVFMGGLGSGQPPAGANIPPVTLHLLIDQSTRALIAVKTAVSMQGNVTTLAVTLSDHDVPIQIAAPPPALVDQTKNGFGGGGNVGGAVPVPTPAPVPAAVESPESP